MNLKKFISGVSAFAIAASAFAAMAVTASADTTYTKVSVTPSSGKNVSDKGTYYQNTYTADNGYSYVVADISGLTDIERASTVTVEFDTKISSGTTLYYGLGDKETRGTDAYGSTDRYKSGGLVMAFGSANGSKYMINGEQTPKNGIGADIHAVVTLDKVNHTYSYNISAGSVVFEDSDIPTSVENMDVVEAFTVNSKSKTFVFKNIEVSYTVPDAPAVPVVSTEVVAAQAFTTPDYDEDVVVGVINLNVSEAAIDLADAKFEGREGTVTGVVDTTFQGQAYITVVLSGETSTGALDNVKFD